MLVTSANLTEAALDRNTELGLLIRARALAASLARHFQALIDRETVATVGDGLTGREPIWSTWVADEQKRDQSPKKSLDERLLEDIGKSGFPLELRVSHELLTRGYFVEHNVYYVDKDEQKGREIEISALRNSQSHPRDREPIWVRVRLLVDCKKAQADKPWVIFTSPVTNYESYARTIMQAGLHEPEKLEADSIASVTAYHPYWLMPRRGRSYYEGFKGPDTPGPSNTIHRGVMSVVKATIDRMDEDKGYPFVMYQPVIVLEGRLFEAFLDESRQITLGRQPWIPLSFSYRSAAYDNRRFTVLFVEETNLPELLGMFDETLRAWALLFDQNPKLLKQPPRR